MLSEKEIREVVRQVVEKHLAQPCGAPPSSIVSQPPFGAPSSPAPGLSSPASPASVLALGADHGGYELKEKLKPLLYELGWSVDDCGTHSEAPVDYPTVALRVALKVGRGEVLRGIMIDGAGIGSCMTANKVPGVRAALCHDIVTAKNSREHNDANLLTLGGRLIGITQAQEIVRTWLAGECKDERHKKRVALITDIERRFSVAGPA